MKNEIIKIEITKIEIDKKDIQTLIPLLERLDTRLWNTLNKTTDTRDQIENISLDDITNTLNTIEDETRNIQELLWTLTNFITSPTEQDTLTYHELTSPPDFK